MLLSATPQNTLSLSIFLSLPLFLALYLSLFRDCIPAYTAFLFPQPLSITVNGRNIKRGCNMRWPGKERKTRRESMGGASHHTLLLTSVLIVSQQMKVIFSPWQSVSDASAGVQSSRNPTDRHCPLIGYQKHVASRFLLGNCCQSEKAVVLLFSQLVSVVLDFFLFFCFFNKNKKRRRGA